MTDTSPRQAAHRYAQRGWEVLPCHHICTAGCSCGQLDCSSPGKHPRTRNGLNEATTNPEQIAQWWRRWPQANVAIRTGIASGLVVVDIDPDHGGIDGLRALVNQHGTLPSGLRARTGSGGWHLYFAHPGETVRNSAGRLAAGVDVRGDGGYVVAPPSRHRSGRPYVFNDPNAPVPRLPSWLEQLVRPEPQRRIEPQTVHVSEAIDAWVRAAILNEASVVRSAPEGTRNAALNRAAFSLGQIAGSGIIEPDTIRTVLADSALDAGLGQREIDATIRSGLNAGLRTPRRPRQRDPPDIDVPGH